MNEKGSGLRFRPLARTQCTSSICKGCSTPGRRGRRDGLGKSCLASYGSARFSPAAPSLAGSYPLPNSSDAHGAWRRYYARYEEMTSQRIDPSRLDLVPELQSFVPPAVTLDKHTYSPWTETCLLPSLHSRRIDTVIVSGGETDFCVLATVLGAADAGFRVVVATDALCSSVNETHDAVIDFYHERLSEQIEAAEVDEISDSWPA